MSPPSRSPAPASSLRQVLVFARQSLLDPHHGSALGAGWLLLLPLAQILIYTLVFAKVMGARLGISDSTYGYGLYLVPGVLLWGAFANTVNQLASVYSARAAIIRKVPVSLVAMPAYVPLVELCLWAVPMALLALFVLVMGPGLTAWWFLLPLACFTTLLLAYGLGLMLAALSLFAPDLRPMVSVVLQLAFWLTPIVYVIDILPAWVGRLMAWHPVYWGIAPAQQIVLRGEPAGVAGIAWQAGLGVVLCLAGAWLVRRLERDIRDLL